MFCAQNYFRSPKIPLIANLRTYFLDRSRLFVYSWGVIFVFLFLSVKLIIGSNFVSPQGYYTLIDFRALWSAAYLAVSGRAADAYDPNILNQICWSLDPYIRMVNTGMYDPATIPVRLYWLYPPTYLLVVAPLGLLPLTYSCILYLMGSFVGYLAVLKKFVPNNSVLLALIAFPAVWSNFRLGQNGYLITTLFGLALLLLPKSPRLAGIFIGALCIKPHLALMFPVALLAIGAWSTILIAFVSGLIFIAASVYFLGFNAWEGWFNSLRMARLILETYPFHWNFSPSVFALMRLSGAPLSLAYSAHFIVAILVASAVWKVWRTYSSWRIRQSILVLASILASPYMMDYDLTLLALPIALIANEGIEYGWMPSERQILMMLWALPMLMVFLSFYTSIQVGPIVLLLAIVFLMRRARRHLVK